jgi:hypothetical protein
VHVVWLALAVLGLPGCHHDSFIEEKRDGSVLDGMELTAARRVGLASAADAMQQRDLKRLKMLSTWVRHRAQVVLLDPDDLASLDLAITCLDDSLAKDEREAVLDRIKTGKLREPARAVCLDEPSATDDQ